MFFFSKFRSHRSPQMTTSQAGNVAPRPSKTGVRVLGNGSFAPRKVLSNDELAQMVETSDEWIHARTGMRERRVVEDGQATSDLAVEAGRRALADAGLDPLDIDLIVVATITSDRPTPATASYVQAQLGASRAVGFDIGAACTGFLYAQQVAQGMLESGIYRRALVIGAEALSSMTDYQDRGTCILFGDGAGARVLGVQAGERGDRGGSAGESSGRLLDIQLGLDGTGADTIQVPAGGSRLPSHSPEVQASDHCLQLNGREVFRFAVSKCAEAIRQIVTDNGLTLEDLDHIVPHQANARIIEAAADKLGLPIERFVVDVEHYGNTGAASVPMAYDHAVRQGRIRSGDLVCEVAFGGGLTWGASLLRA